MICELKIGKDDKVSHYIQLKVLPQHLSGRTEERLISVMTVAF
jgi:hypothetical protein